MSDQIKTLNDLKVKLQSGFDSNEESLVVSGKTYTTHLKAYLIEINNLTPTQIKSPDGKWKKLEDSTGWYKNISKEKPNSFFLDATRDRVWIIYSMLEANESDFFVDKWIKTNQGVDRCYLTRNHLLHWKKVQNWRQRGLSLTFNDGLSSEDQAANFHLKAYYGDRPKIEGLTEIIEKAKESFVIHSVRWQKRTEEKSHLTSEWYNFGKVTINRALDIDESLISVSEIANYYLDSLKQATKLRDESLGAFELNFSQEIDLDAFSKKVMKGSGEMRLWLAQTESNPDFYRFRGIDLHTWDRILLDIGLNFAYLTIPAKGCVNAAPRIATIQGEDNAGRTIIYHDGVEVFA